MLRLLAAIGEAVSVVAALYTLLVLPAWIMDRHTRRDERQFRAARARAAAYGIADRNDLAWPRDEES